MIKNADFNKMVGEDKMENKAIRSEDEEVKKKFPPLPPQPPPPIPLPRKRGTISDGGKVG